MQAAVLITDTPTTPCGDFPMVISFSSGILTATFDSYVFASESISRLCSCMSTVLTYMESHPDALVRDVPLIDEKTAPDDLVSTVLGPLCESRMSDPLVHEEFEKVAALKPDDVCLVLEGVTMSYSEVNQRANCVACVLLERGLQPGQLVGILLERSFELVFGILGVLKAGGGYVPVRVMPGVQCRCATHSLWLPFRCSALCRVV